MSEKLAQTQQQEHLPRNRNFLAALITQPIEFQQQQVCICDNTQFLQPHNTKLSAWKWIPIRRRKIWKEHRNSRYSPPADSLEEPKSQSSISFWKLRDAILKAHGNAPISQMLFRTWSSAGITLSWFGAAKNPWDVFPGLARRNIQYVPLKDKHDVF